MGSSHITWNEWNNIPSLFLDLRNEEDFFDVTLAIDEDNQFPAHKVILSAASPFFRGLLKRNPSQHPSIVMSPHVRPADLQNIIDFIYQGEVNVPQSELDNFLSVGEALKIRGLTPNGDEMSGKKDKKPPQMPTGGAQMNRKRQPGPMPSQPPKQNPQAKRPRGGAIGSQMMSPPKFSGPQGAIPQNVPPSREADDGNQGLDQDDTTPVDEDSNDIYAEYVDEAYENPEGFPLDTPPPTSGIPAGFSQPVLTGVICPNCRGKFTVEDLKVHMPTCQGPGSAAASQSKQSQKPIKDPGEKTDICQFCDKAFKGRTNLKAHIRRTHRMPDGSLPTGIEAGQADFQEYPVEGQEGAMMDPNLHPGSQSPHPGPGKKKGRPRKADQQQVPRPIGQVTPAPRPSNDGIKNIHEQSRPPVQQDRGASPMMQARHQGQRPTGMMSPSSGPMGNKRPMQPRGIMGPGMRPRGSAPQQFQQGYPGHPMDISLLGKKLGGAISITSSDQNSGGVGNSGQPQQQASMRRPMPSTSRQGMHAVSSPKSDPLAGSMGNSGGARQPSIPAQRGQQGQGQVAINQDPVEVKQEPMDDIYEEDMHDDFDDGEEEEGDFGEEEEEDGDEDQDFGGGPMDDMYAGEPPYDDDVEHDQAGYQQ